jgi:hypothetical protein
MSKTLYAVMRMRIGVEDFGGPVRTRGGDCAGFVEGEELILAGYEEKGLVQKQEAFASELVLLTYHA